VGRSWAVGRFSSQTSQVAVQASPAPRICKKVAAQYWTGAPAESALEWRSSWEGDVGDPRLARMVQGIEAAGRGRDEVTFRLPRGALNSRAEPFRVEFPIVIQREARGNRAGVSRV
jgi:hypothetical protein